MPASAIDDAMAALIAGFEQGRDNDFVRHLARGTGAQQQVDEADTRATGGEVRRGLSVVIDGVDLRPPV